MANYEVLVWPSWVWPSRLANHRQYWVHHQTDWRIVQPILMVNDNWLWLLNHGVDKRWILYHNLKNTNMNCLHHNRWNDDNMNQYQGWYEQYTSIRIINISRIIITITTYHNHNNHHSHNYTYKHNKHNDNKHINH